MVCGRPTAIRGALSQDLNEFDPLNKDAAFER